MAVLTWSVAAKQDLAAIRDYHASSSPGYTRTLISKLFDAVTQLETFPRMGRQSQKSKTRRFVR